MSEREKFTVVLPEPVQKLRGGDRDKKIAEICAKLANVQPRPDMTKKSRQITISMHDDGGDKATLEFWSHSDDPRTIIQAAGLKPVDLISLGVPEGLQKEEPGEIEKKYKGLAAQLTQAAQKQNGTSEGAHTIVDVRSVTPDKTSVELRVSGNVDLVRHIIQTKTKLTING